MNIALYLINFLFRRINRHFPLFSYQIGSYLTSDSCWVWCLLCWNIVNRSLLQPFVTRWNNMYSVLCDPKRYSNFSHFISRWGNETALNFYQKILFAWFNNSWKVIKNPWVLLNKCQSLKWNHYWNCVR